MFSIWSNRELFNNNNNMVIMENYCSPQDKFKELWIEIDRCHLSYLELEESPEKLEQRNKLEEYINEYLCVPFNCNKFTLTETEEVLERSANSKKDFSGYKAAAGFNAIQLYAGNLLSQPWRKEYRQIKTYCGFYKHQIEANLVGAELMFEAMGYKHDDDGLLILDGPICPDRVAAVSKDCLVAYVECQILKSIWEDVSSPPFMKITWQEVLEFRKMHLCSPVQCVKALKYKQHQRQYQEQSHNYTHGSNHFPNSHQQSAPLAPVVPMNHTFTTLNNHHHVGLPPPPAEYMYTNGGCSNNYGTYPPSYYMSYQHPIMTQQFNTNGYCCNGFVPPQLPSYQYGVPTAQLIELESQNSPTYDMPDRGAHKVKQPEVINNDLYKNKNNNLPDRESEKNESQLEDWEYVYRNLESQGYSKDLGERGDVLSPNSVRLAKENRKVKATNLDEALNNLTVNNKPLKLNEALKRLEREKSKPVEVIKHDKQTSPSSSYDNVASNELMKPQSASKITPIVSYAKTKSLPREKNQLFTDRLNQSRTIDSRKVKEEKGAKKKGSLEHSTEKWQCKACTYINETAGDICDMCSKSRHTTLDHPMEIGGAECRKCTLVNPKNVKNCQACDEGLEDSATYI